MSESVKKTCRACGASKALEDFSRKKGCRFGRNTICRRCDCLRFFVPRLDFRLELPPHLAHCHGCQLTKPKAQFYVDRTKVRGIGSRCAECSLAASLAYKKQPAVRQRRNARSRELRQEDPEHRARKLASEARYSKANRAKTRAHVAVWAAIADGRLTKKPCEVCGAEEAQAHHDDYAKRFDVRWLCPLHHKAWHAEHGEGANADAPPREPGQARDIPADEVRFGC